MAGLCEGNEPPGSLKVICESDQNDRNSQLVDDASNIHGIGLPGPGASSLLPRKSARVNAAELAGPHETFRHNAVHPGRNCHHLLLCSIPYVTVLNVVCP
ncbi:hypothetical protein ANN_20288 [Periplaneta americana]|uniref:Uncharacterized protein n=1 Tax=Periplaneta americana TaxID=6978 RepID=A0ABQ8SCY4_PERAM|nr:hypothetical protein ANN_20288 [Periplaneta americana]